MMQRGSQTSSGLHAAMSSGNNTAGKIIPVADHAVRPINLAWDALLCCILSVPCLLQCITMSSLLGHRDGQGGEYIVRNIGVA